MICRKASSFGEFFISVELPKLPFPRIIEDSLSRIEELSYEEPSDVAQTR